MIISNKQVKRILKLAAGVRGTHIYVSESGLAIRNYKTGTREDHGMIDLGTVCVGKMEGDTVKFRFPFVREFLKNCTGPLSLSLRGVALDLSDGFQETSVAGEVDSYCSPLNPEADFEVLDKEALFRALVYASTEQVCRGPLCAVKMEDGYFVSTDGKRLLQTKCETSRQSDTLLPSFGILALKKAKAQTISYSETAGHVIYRADWDLEEPVYLSYINIGAGYPSWREVFPKGQACATLKLKTEDLVEALARQEKVAPFVFHMGKDFSLSMNNGEKIPCIMHEGSRKHSLLVNAGMETTVELMSSHIRDLVSMYPKETFDLKISFDVGTYWAIYTPTVWEVRGDSILAMPIIED